MVQINTFFKGSKCTSIGFENAMATCCCCCFGMKKIRQIKNDKATERKLIEVAIKNRVKKHTQLQSNCNRYTQ